MSCHSRLQFFLDMIPNWPPSEGMADTLAATNWITKLGALTADYTPAERFAAVELKTTDKAAIWVERWNRVNIGVNRDWNLFANDFILEAIKNRSEEEPTWDEITEFKQGPDEPTANYVERMKLTLQLLPPEEDGKYASSKYKISPGSEKRVAYYFCRGLRSDHPFKKEDQKPQPTINETFREVMNFSNMDCGTDVESPESRAIKRYIAAMAQTNSNMIKLGTQNVEQAKFDKFENDFPAEQTENLSMDELANMFEAWCLTEKVTEAAVRITRTIKRMDPDVARRMFSGTELEKYIIS